MKRQRRVPCGTRRPLHRPSRPPCFRGARPLSSIDLFRARAAFRSIDRFCPIEDRNVAFGTFFQLHRADQLAQFCVKYFFSCRNGNGSQKFILPWTASRRAQYNSARVQSVREVGRFPPGADLCLAVSCFSQCIRHMHPCAVDMTVAHKIHWSALPREFSWEARPCRWRFLQI